MQKLFLFLGLLISFILVSPSSALADDECKEDPRACFDGFRDDDSIDPKDEDVEKTFNFPAIKAGFIVDFGERDVLPHISVEVVEFSVPKIGDFALDVGVASSRVFSSLTWELIPIVKVGPSIWAGYNVKDNEPAFGVGVSILDF